MPVARVNSAAAASHQLASVLQRALTVPCGLRRQGGSAARTTAMRAWETKAHDVSRVHEGDAQDSAPPGALRMRSAAGTRARAGRCGRRGSPARCAARCAAPPPARWPAPARCRRPGRRPPRKNRSKTRSSWSGGMPGPSSTTSTTGMPVDHVQPHVDHAALGRIAHRVVDQVVEHAAQLGRRGADPGRDAALEADVDPALVGQHHELADAVAQQRRDVDRPAGARRRRVLPRQAQQLLDQVLGALDAAFELGEALGGIARRHVGAQVLDLQADRGHRRAQLVRRVLHEAPLRRQACSRSRPQQAVEGGHQRRDFLRHAGDRQLVRAAPRPAPPRRARRRAASARRPRR